MDIDLKELHKKPPYGIIAILFIGAFVSLLNNTLLNVALPTIMVEFDVSPSMVQWVSTSFMLVNGILVPASAFLIQKYSNRQIFMTAMSLFTIGTFIAMISPSFMVLIIGRMLQAAGSAMMMPLLMNIMLVAFPIERRGTAMGMFGLVMFAAPAIGPTLSGWVIEHYSWRTLFALVLPFGIFTLAFAFFRLKNLMPVKNIKLDYVSIILSSLGFGGLLYGFSSAGDKGWSSPVVYITIIIGLVSLVMFILKQMNMKEPMLDFGIYRYPMFALSSVIAVAISISMFSGMLLTPLYMQTIRGFSPIDSGLLMLPGAIVTGLMSPVTGRLFDKIGARILAVFGLSVLVVTTFMLSRLSMEISYSSLMILYTTRMFGMSLVSMPVMTNGLNQLPMSANPHGTAINNTLQQVSGAIGSAVLLTVMTGKMNAAKVTIGADIASGKLVTPYAVDQLAMLNGINFSFFISTIFAVIALVLSMFIVKPERHPDNR